MSRLPLVGQEDLDAEQKALWDYLLNGPRAASLSGPIKYLPGPFNPWMQIPSFGKLAAEMGERLRFRSVLPGKLRELAILTAGAHWKAEFEFWAHARAARAEGLPDSVINALQAGTGSLRRRFATSRSQRREGPGRNRPPARQSGRGTCRQTRMAVGRRAGRPGRLLLHGLVHAERIRRRSSRQRRANLESLSNSHALWLDT